MIYSRLSLYSHSLINLYWKCNLILLRTSTHAICVVSSKRSVVCAVYFPARSSILRCFHSGPVFKDRLSMKYVLAVSWNNSSTKMYFYFARTTLITVGNGKIWRMKKATLIKIKIWQKTDPRRVHEEWKENSHHYLAVSLLEILQN